MPILKWFQQCFAGVIIETALVRVWDKLYGGGASPKILPFLLIKILYYARKKLLQCDGIDGVKDAISAFNFGTDQEVADLIVNKAIEINDANLKVHQR